MWRHRNALSSKPFERRLPAPRIHARQYEEQSAGVHTLSFSSLERSDSDGPRPSDTIQLILHTYILTIYITRKVIQMIQIVLNLRKNLKEVSRAVQSITCARSKKIHLIHFHFLEYTYSTLEYKQCHFTYGSIAGARASGSGVGSSRRNQASID